MFAIEMLPAENGDCLFIEYGDAKHPKRILIDGGTAATGPVLRDRIERLGSDDRKFELMVVTHIDTDHIDGVLTLLKDPSEKLLFDQIWFNGYPQIEEASQYLGPIQGEYLGVYIDKLEQKRKGTWNGAFDGHAVMTRDDKALPSVELDGGLRLTVLAPGIKAIKKLADQWKDVIEELGMTPGNVEEAEERLLQDKRYAPGYLGSIDVEKLADTEFKQDTSITNGSCIVLLAEYEGHRCLLTGDAFPSEILDGLNRYSQDQRIELSAMKVPHHGSRKNNTNELYRAVDCQQFLVSTNGKTHSHPNQEAIARVLYNKRGKATLLFNYQTDFNNMWDGKDTKAAWKYNVIFPENDDAGLRLEL